MLRSQIESLLINEMGVRRTRSNTNNIICCCPVHRENNPSFGINFTSPPHPWNCYSCGARGASVKSLVMQVLSVGPRAADAILNRYGGLEESDVSVDFPDYLDALPSSEMLVPRHHLEAYSHAPEWRGLSPEIVRGAELRVDKYGNLIVPYFWDGKLVGLCSRPKNAKMMPMNGFQFKRTLYASPEASLGDGLILVEGFSDALRMMDYGHLNVAAVNGTSFTREQEIQVRGVADRKVILMPDNDNGGKTMVSSIRKRLGDLDLKLCSLTRSKDPCDAGFVEIALALKSMRTII